VSRVQLKKAEKIKRMRKANFNYLYKHLSKWKDYLILPESIPNADVCWFAFPITAQNGLDRGKLLKHLEKAGIETRPMFAGNVTKHPMCANIKYKVSGNLDEANLILNHSFWVSCHPSLTQNDREYIIKTFEDFFETKTKRLSKPS